jgi:hypothetical protein
LTGVVEVYTDPDVEKLKPGSTAAGSVQVPDVAQTLLLNPATIPALAALKIDRWSELRTLRRAVLLDDIIVLSSSIR